MSYDIEKQLYSVEVQSMTEAEKNSVWFSIASKQKELPKNLLISFFSKKYMMATLLALVVILGGGGVVVASNDAIPGDVLYPVDQVVENIQIKLTGDEGKKNELKVKFAEERLSEFEEVITKNSQSTKDVDLSSAKITEVEIDVFTNETTVSIEADDKKYGFVTKTRDKDQIISEIQTKYKLSLEQINSNLSFEMEDRDSRADDKKFLNSANSIEFKSDKQKQEFEGSLSSVSDFVVNSNLSAEEKDRLSTTLNSIIAILAVNPNLEIEMKTVDGVKIEVEDGKIEIKTKGSKLDDDKKYDDSDNDDSDDGDDDNPSQNHGNDIRENDDEVFCRGEWRDAEDCDVNGNNDSDDDSENDNNDSNDSDDDDLNEDEDDNNNDTEDEDEDDNSGKGKNNNDSDDDEDSNDD